MNLNHYTTTGSAIRVRYQSINHDCRAVTHYERNRKGESGRLQLCLHPGQNSEN